MTTSEGKDPEIDAIVQEYFGTPKSVAAETSQAREATSEEAPADQTVTVSSETPDASPDAPTPGATLTADLQAPAAPATSAESAEVARLRADLSETRSFMRDIIQQLKVPAAAPKEEGPQQLNNETLFKIAAQLDPADPLAAMVTELAARQIQSEARARGEQEAIAQAKQARDGEAAKKSIYEDIEKMRATYQYVDEEAAFINHVIEGKSLADAVRENDAKNRKRFGIAAKPAPVVQAAGKVPQVMAPGAPVSGEKKFNPKQYRKMSWDDIADMAVRDM